LHRGQRLQVTTYFKRRSIYPTIGNFFLILKGRNGLELFGTRRKGGYQKIPFEEGIIN